MRIVQINTLDTGGGAERIAWDLFTSYRKRGHKSWFAVGDKKTDHPNVIRIPRQPIHIVLSRFCFGLKKLLRPLDGHVYGIHWLRSKLNALAPHPTLHSIMGQEDFNLPESRRLLDLLPEKPDILHGHNLHPAGYFDLRYLAELSHQLPVVLTLHDAWLLSGHCAHSFECERWKQGCGHCPDLTIYPASTRDATDLNWQQKQAIFRQSRLYVATPSAWLMDKVRQSMLLPAIQDARVIPNGIDLTVFAPAPRQEIRKKLNIPQEARVLHIAANGIRKNTWKDYQTMQAAIEKVALSWQGVPLLFLALGENAPRERIGETEIRFIPHQRDRKAVAEYYQAADIYIHAARADTFPTTILEALACGLPVVATAVGGIPEQVEDGVTGFLVPSKDSQAMAERILLLLGNDVMRGQFSVQAAEAARRKYDLNRQVDDYLVWYEQILSSQHKQMN